MKRNVLRIAALSLLTGLLCLARVGSFAQQNVGIGITTPAASAMLDVFATDKGILIPRLTTVQRVAIVAPATGLLVYDTDFKQFWYFDGTIWVQAIGPQGPTGPQGMQGPTGPNGATGTQGIQGPTGADGATGPQGIPGIQGPTGADGATGPQGIPGIQGPTGADGTTGPQGNQGIQGVTGANGTPGVPGPSGANGVTGPAGPAGPTGPSGAANAWLLTGNAGTIPGTNFLGTTDPIDMVFKTNSAERMRILSAGNIGIGTATPAATNKEEFVYATTTAAGKGLYLSGTGNNIWPNYNYGVYSYVINNDIGMEEGLHGHATSSTAGNGRNWGVVGYANNGGTNVGVKGYVPPSGYSTGILGVSVGFEVFNEAINMIGDWAGYFSGPVKITGNLGIGLTPSYQLQLSLDNAAKPASSAWTIASDIRLKDVKGKYHKGLAEIIQLDPIIYRYKKDNPLGIKETEKDCYGFIAQDVQKIFPEAVGTDDKGYLNFNIHPILIASINAIKELNAGNKHIPVIEKALLAQQDQIDALKAENNTLKSSSTDTELRLQKAESEIAQLKKLMEDRKNQGHVVYNK